MTQKPPYGTHCKPILPIKVCGLTSPNSIYRWQHSFGRKVQEYFDNYGPNIQEIGGSSFCWSKVRRFSALEEPNQDEERQGQKDRMLEQFSISIDEISSHSLRRSTLQPCVGGR